MVFALRGPAGAIKALDKFDIAMYFYHDNAMNEDRDGLQMKNEKYNCRPKSIITLGDYSFIDYSTFSVWLGVTLLSI